MTGTEAFRRELEKSTARLLHFGVSYGDWRKAAEESEHWEAFSDALAEMAERYEAAGDAAAQSEQKVSAAGHWRRAAVYFHYAQFKLGHGDRKRDRQRRCQKSHAKAAKWLEPPASRIEVRCGGASFPGYLRVPRRPFASCVVLINGLDSAKEVELHAFAEGFLRRGNAVFYWDGPGQGEGANGTPMHRYSEVVSAVLDRLAGETGDVPFGLFGVSFGGYLACHAAASDPRIEACVSLGGFHDARIAGRLPEPALANLRAAYGLPADSSIDALRDAITLAPLRGQLRGSLLIVHGTNDHLVDRAQVEALQEWGGANATSLIYDGAEHVCTDRFGECLPALWDWMTQRLRYARPMEVAW